MAAAVTLGAPTRLCEVRADLALSERTAFELARCLEDEGFQWRIMPRSTDERLKLSYTHGREGEQKVWFTQGGTIIPSYCKCLLQAEHLASHHKIESIPHWHHQPHKVYPAILSGEQPSLPAAP